MADLAQLGIVINVSDQNAAQKLTALSTAADKAATSTDKLENAAKRASDALDKVGAGKATESLNRVKRATDEISVGYAKLLGDINKLDRAFSEVGKTQQGIKDLQKNLNAIAVESKKAYEAGKLSTEGYNRLGTASDALSLKLREQKTALDALATGHYNAQQIAARDLQLKQQQIAMEKLHAQAIKENAAFDKQRQAQYAYEQKNIAALNSFKEKQIALQRETAASYAAADRESQIYNRQLRAQGEELNRLNAAFNKVIARVKQFSAFIVAAAIITTFTKAVRGTIGVIIEFDQALKSLQAIAGATATEASVMGDIIKKIAADTKFSAGEVALGMQTIGKAGFTASEALKMIRGVSNLATGALEDFNTVSGLVVTAIRAFGLEVVQTNQITDIFANAITKSKLSVDMLITAFGYVGAAGAQAGLSLEEVSGTLMVLADNGIRASTMGTAFRKTLLSMIAPNKSLKDALDQVGMSVDQINPGIVGYEQALKNIAPLVWDFAQGTVDMAKAKEFFGLRATQVAAILIRETAQGGGISRAIESTKELGAALKMAEKQQEGLGVKFKNLSDTIKNIALAMGEAGLTSSLHKLVGALKAAASGVEWFIKNVPIIQFLGWAAAISATVLVLQNLAKILAAVKIATLALWAVLTKTPVGQFILVVSAAAAAITALTKFLGDSSEAYRKNSVAIKENVTTIDGWIRVLQEAKTEGLVAYNSMLVRFVSENKKLSQQLVDVVNKHELLNGVTVRSVDQIAQLSGEFEEYSEIVEKAMKIMSFEEAEKSLMKFTKSLNSELQKFYNSRNLLESSYMFGDINEKQFERQKQLLAKNFSEIETELTRFAKELNEWAKKSGQDEDTFIRTFLEQNFTGGPEALEIIFEQIKAIIVKNFQEIKYIMDKFPSYYFGDEELEDFVKAFTSTQDYIKQRTLSDYELKKRAAEKHYKDTLTLAVKEGLDTTEIHAAYNEELAKLWADELERRKKALDDRLKLEKQARQWILDYEIQNIRDQEEARQKADDEAIKAMNKLMAEEKKSLDEINALIEKDKYSRLEKYDAELAKLTDTYQKIRQEAEQLGMDLRRIDEWYADERARILEEKSKKEVTEYQKLYEKALENIQDMIADTFYDAFQGNIKSFSDMADAMLNIFKQMIAQMMAHAVMNRITPMFGNMLGGLTGGAPGTQGASGFPGFSGLSNLPGMGWLGATIPGTSSAAILSGGASAGMAYPGGMGAAPAGFGGGVTWGTALGAGAIGSLGYSAIGGAMGLPQSKYSGITSGLGAAGMSAYGGLTGIGVLGGPIGIAIGAALGGVLGGLFGDDSPDPRVGLFAGTGSQGAYRQSGQGYFFHTNVQDMPGSAGDPIVSYYDSVFAALDKMTEKSINDILNESNFGAHGRFSWFDPTGMDLTQILEKMTNDLFSAMREGLVADMGLDTEVFGRGFFENIKLDGETLLDTYARFRSVVEGTDGFVDDLSRRIYDMGQSAETAYQQIQTISVVMSEMETAFQQVVGSGMQGQINAMAATWDQYISVLRDAHATVEQLTEAERKKNAVIGAQITGLNAANIAQALTSGGDINSILQKSITDAMAASTAEAVIQSYIVPLNEAIGVAFRETGNIEAAMALLSGFDLAGAHAEIAGFQARVEQMFGELIPTVPPELTANLTTAEEALVAAEARLGKFTEELDRAKESLSNAQSALSDAESALNTAISKEKQLADARINAANRLDQLINDLMGGSMAPVQSLEFFEKRYDQLLTAAQSAQTADEINKAVGDLANFTNQYLNFAGAYGGDNYNDLFIKITGDLKEIEIAQRTEGERQLARLSSINAILGNLADTATDIDTALRNYIVAQLAFNKAQASVNQAQGKVNQASSEVEAAKLAIEAAQAAIEAIKMVTEPQPAQAYDPVLALYKSIGREGFGTEVHQIDQSGYDYWKAESMHKNYAELADSFYSGLKEYMTNASQEDLYYQYIKSQNIGFSGGGIISGPQSGYKMPGATFHGAEMIVPLDGKPIPVIVHGGGSGDIKIIVKIGDRELKDVTTEVIRTYEPAQTQIRRVANG